MLPVHSTLHALRTQVNEQITVTFVVLLLGDYKQPCLGHEPIMKLSTNNSILANRSSGGSNKHESTKKPTREVNNKSAFFNSPIFYLPLVLNVVCVISSGSRRPVRNGSRTRSKTNIVKKLPQAENIGPPGSCECVKNYRYFRTCAILLTFTLQHRLILHFTQYLWPP